MDLLTRMVEHHIWLVGEMLTRAERLDDEVLDSPIELSVDGVDCDPTLRSLLSRLVGQLAMWDAATHDRQYDFDIERDESVAQHAPRLAEAGPAFLMQVREIVDDGRIDETFVDASCGPPRVFTYGGMIAHVLTFAARSPDARHAARLAAGGVTDLGAGIPCSGIADPA